MTNDHPPRVVDIIKQISKYDDLYIKFVNSSLPLMAKHCIKKKNELLEQLVLLL